jgi:hypothetical protein
MAASRSAQASPACRQPELTESYVHRVTRALRARRDLWGDSLLAAPHGPTHAGAARYLKPLLFPRAVNGRPLTESGVHYAAFGEPEGAWGATSVACTWRTEARSSPSGHMGGSSRSPSAGEAWSATARASSV